MLVISPVAVIKYLIKATEEMKKLFGPIVLVLVYCDGIVSWSPHKFGESRDKNAPTWPSSFHLCSLAPKTKEWCPPPHIGSIFPAF